MEHFYLDRHSEGDSFMHRLDPRSKLLGVFLLILFIVFTRPDDFFSFISYAALIVFLILLSKIPPIFFFKKSLVVIPFVLAVSIFIPFFKEGEVAGGYSFGTLKLTVTYDGLTIFFNILVKSYMSALCMILLVSSTRFSALLKGLEKLKVPKLFASLLSFMYRYIFVIIDELMKMRQAKAARSVGGSWWFHTKTLANMIGVLFIRSYERSETVYMAMLSRGFSGNINAIYDFRLKKSDILFMSLLTVTLFLIRVKV